MDNPDPFNGDEDAALRYAIQLSLQEVEEPSTELQSDPDSSDDDLDRQPTYPAVTRVVGSSSTQGSKGASLPTSQVPTSTGGLAGLDRKKMEEERLARLGKRKAPDSTQETQEHKQKARIDGKSLTTSHPTNLPFPTGVVKKTWASGYARTGDDIKIEEVLQKDKLEMAVLSSFQWDEDWLLSKIDIRKTKMLLIAFASGVAQVFTIIQLQQAKDLSDKE